MANLEMELLIETRRLTHRVLELPQIHERLCLLMVIWMVMEHWIIWTISQTIVFEVLHAHLDNMEDIYAWIHLLENMYLQVLQCMQLIVEQEPIKH